MSRVTKSGCTPDWQNFSGPEKVQHYFSNECIQCSSMSTNTCHYVRGMHTSQSKCAQNIRASRMPQCHVQYKSRCVFRVKMQGEGGCECVRVCGCVGEVLGGVVLLVMMQFWACRHPPQTFVGTLCVAVPIWSM